MSYLNVYLPCCSNTLQGPKMYAVVHTSLLHKMHVPSVVILSSSVVNLLRLVGDNRVWNFETRQNKVRFGGIANKVVQEKSCYL